MNLTIIIGNLTRDPELRYTDSGTAVTNFSVAVNNGKDQRGEERDPTFFDVTAWKALAERVSEYCRKGKKVCVQGRMEKQTWDDRDSGEKKSKWVLQAFSVEFLSPREQDDEPTRAPIRSGPRPAAPDAYADLDDLPF